MGKKKTFIAGQVYVDTGQLYIGDPMYVVAPEEGQPSWDEFTKRVTGGQHQADGEQPEVASEPFGKGGGIVIPSGVGDGIYPVHITIENDGHISSAFILFDQ
jgi:hypothetical protein